MLSFRRWSNADIGERLRQAFDVAGVDHVGRQQAQHRGVAAGAREYVTLEQRVAHPGRGCRAAQAEQQPLALDARHRPRDAGRADLRLAFAHVVHQVLAGDGVHHGLDGGGGDRSAAEGGAQVAGAQLRRQRLGGEQRAAGEAAAERFRGRDDVCRDACMLDRERQPGATGAALHLVGDEDGAVRLGRLTERAQERRRQVEGAGHALHGLDDDGGGAVVHGVARRLRVVAGHEYHLERQAGERIPALAAAPGHGGRGGAAAVESVLDGHHLAPSGGETRDPERVLVGLGAAVHEQGAGEVIRREGGQFLGGARAHGQRRHIALEQERLHLPLDGGEQRRVVVAERGHGMAAVEVQDVPAVRRVQVHAAGADRLDGQVGVDRQGAGGLDGGGAAARVRVRVRVRVDVHGRPHIQPGAGCVRPAVSGSDHRRFIHCMAPPAAPFSRLSMTTNTAAVEPSAATPMWA
jgi:hypothetical protein